MALVGARVKVSLPKDFDESEARKRALLRRIATALGAPEAGLLDEAAAQFGPDGPYELLRTWNDIECLSDRRKLLAFARLLAARH